MWSKPLQCTSEWHIGARAHVKLILMMLSLCSARNKSKYSPKFCLGMPILYEDLKIQDLPGQHAGTSGLGHSLPRRAGSDGPWDPFQHGILWFYGVFFSGVSFCPLFLFCQDDFPPRKKLRRWERWIPDVCNLGIMVLSIQREQNLIVTEVPRCVAGQVCKEHLIFIQFYFSSSVLPLHRVEDVFAGWPLW